jgi:hypothetical protein
MTNSLEHDEYYQNVIQRWDEASGSFKDACFEASWNTWLGKQWLINKDGSLKTQWMEWLIKANKIDIDGAGNKPRIYCNQFEHIIQALEKNEITGETAKEEATELRYRLLMDLFAMNADDLRDGQVAVHLTNIIDINHLKWIRWHLFQDSMAQAMKKAIEKVDIPMTAGETAVLWQNEEARKIQKATLEMINQIKTTLSNQHLLLASNGLVESVHDPINELIKTLENKIEIIGKWIWFNIWWTTLGYDTWEKLVDIESRTRRWIIAFEEQSEDGIIWPRANGITKIIEDMTEIMGEWREDKTFADFVKVIGTEKAAKIPDSVFVVCAGKKMRDIATGTTTVFNPFISRVLLGWIGGDPIVKIAKLIHVTGNPTKKIAEGVGNKNYRAKIDMTNVTEPQIITLLQIAKDIPDGVVTNKFNMWMPYVTLVAEEDCDEAIQKAAKSWYTANHRWRVELNTESLPNEIIWVWFNKSTITF